MIIMVALSSKTKKNSCRSCHHRFLFLFEILLLVCATTTTTAVQAAAAAAAFQVPTSSTPAAGTGFARRNTALLPLPLPRHRCHPASSMFPVQVGQLRAEPPSYDRNDNDNNNRDNENKNLFQIIDDAGHQLKPSASNASSKANLSEKKSEKIRYLVTSCFLFTLFLLYRAYRGFFVILPAVFRETFHKLETVVDESPFDDDDDDTTDRGLYSSDSGGEPKRLKWRTRITVSVLATVITISYALGGALRVVQRMLVTSTPSSSLSSSSRGITGRFQAAVEEQEKNEQKLWQKTKKNKDDINGSELAP